VQVSTGLQRTPLHLSILHTLVELRFLCENVISLVTRLAVRKRTSSFPVAERPRDASCLSAISFSSRISRAQCSIISYYYGFRFTIAYKCRSVVFGVTLKFLVINTSSSVSRNQQTLPLTDTSHQCHQLATVRRHRVNNM